MNETLSVVVPIFNAQNNLGKEVHELLDVLAELGSPFELLLVDDGSTDQTAEVADEMSRQFPQIRVVRHPRRFGAAAAVRSGLRHAKGELVFVQDEFTPMSSTDLRRLWELRFDDKAAARLSTPGGIEPGLLKRLSDWGIALKKHHSENTRCGIQMIRRHALPHSARPEQLPVG